MIFRQSKIHQTKQSSGDKVSNMNIKDEYFEQQQNGNQLSNEFNYALQQISKNAINPQILQHLKITSQLVKQNKNVKTKYLKLKKEYDQNTRYLSIQNKSLKKAIQNYQQYIQKLFDTCQNLLKNSKQNQIRLNNLQKQQFNYKSQFNNNLQLNSTKIKQKQKVNYIQNGIKRLQKLLNTKYQQYMSQKCSKDNPQNTQKTDYETLFQRKNENEELKRRQIQINQINRQNLQLKRQNYRLVQMSNSNGTILKVLKQDYQRVYKQIFSLKKEKQQLQLDLDNKSLQTANTKDQFDRIITEMTSKFNKLQTQKNEIIKLNQLNNNQYQQTNMKLLLLQKDVQQTSTEKQQIDIYKQKTQTIQQEFSKLQLMKDKQIQQLQQKLKYYQTQLVILKRQKQSKAELTTSQNIQHLEQIRKFKLLQQKYQQMKVECYKLKQEIQTLNVRSQRYKKEISIKQASIDQKIQRIWNLENQITVFQSEKWKIQQQKSKIHNAFTQITKQNSELNQKCSQLQQDKQNLQIQLNIKISQLNAIVQSQPASNQTSKGNLPLQSVVVIQSKIDFLEQQLFKRIKNFHQIQRVNLENVNLNDPHYKCKVKQQQLVKFIEQLEIYVKYLQKQVGSRNQFFGLYTENYRNDSYYRNGNSQFRRQPSIVMNIHPNSSNSIRENTYSANQDTQNPKHSPIIRLDEFQNNKFEPNKWPNHISSQDIVITGSNRQITKSDGLISRQSKRITGSDSSLYYKGSDKQLMKEELKLQSNQAIKIQDDNQYSQNGSISPSPHTASIINPKNYLIERRDNSSLSKFEYSPATTEKNLHKRQVSRYLFQNQNKGSNKYLYENEDKGSKFSFNLFSQKTPDQQDTKQYNQLPDIRYYISRNQDFDFTQQPYKKHKNLQSQLTFYNREDYENINNTGIYPQQTFKSEIKQTKKQYEVISPQKSYQTEMKQNQNKRSFLSGIKNKIMKPSH